MAVSRRRQFSLGIRCLLKPLAMLVFGVGVLVLGVLAFLLWSWNTRRWPFGHAYATP